MNNLDRLYQEVLSNYQSCQTDLQYLSDTWVHTLEQKGRSFPQEEMMYMRAPGNRVSSWMVDTTYMIDHTSLDLDNHYIKRLLELGENDFGHPRKDIQINGHNFSSLFLRDVIHAAQLIQLIESSDIAHPRVLEIGGGIGLFIALIKGYFGDKITIFCVDIPETLFIQEWYLRNCYTDSPHSFKASSTICDFKEGGLNFINAYVLTSQNIKFDIAINMVSMMEIDQKTVNTYFQYIESNISSTGVFFFQNHYGQGTGTFSEPSEYKFDKHWKIEIAQYIYPYICCTDSEHLRLFMRRTPLEEDTKIRRLVLRTIWNGFSSGAIPNNLDLIQDLAKLPQTVTLENASPEIYRVLKKYAIELDKIDCLVSNRYFPYTHYTKNYSQPLFSFAKDKKDKYLPEFYMALVWEVQKQIIQTMSDAVHKAVPLSSLQSRLDNICERLSPSFLSPFTAEYWNAEFAQILFSLGYGEKAIDLITPCITQSTNNRWLLRFAYLFSRYGYLENAITILKQLEGKVDDPFSLIKQIQLEHTCHFGGNYAERLRVILGIEVLKHSSCIDVAKTVAQIGAFDMLREICISSKEIFLNSIGFQFFEVFSQATSLPSKDEARNLIQECYQAVYSDHISDESQLMYGVLMIKLGKDEGLPLVQKLLDVEDYFKLGWAGNILQGAGFNQLADQYLTRSLSLRQNNFIHNNFIGNVYFSAERFAPALKYLKEASLMKPYLRHLYAEVLYCSLPEDIRNSHVFGNLMDFNTLFNFSQNFYGDSPHWK